MSAIAYITDSKMLQLHRLNNHKTMNFWRVSNNINFSDFTIGDLVFFLSKDKEHKNKNEKGIVGFGRVVDIDLGSIKSMWDKYGIYNGYKTIEEFKEAIIKVSKDKKLPKKISSFYLEDVQFFHPIYLSECGFKISNNTESYIYLKDEEIVYNLLDLAKKSKDIWSSIDIDEKTIESEELLFTLFTAHKYIKDIKTTEKLIKKGKKELNKYIENNKEYNFIQNSNLELYKVDNNIVEILFYNHKDIDNKLLIGQANLYKQWVEHRFANTYILVFKSFDDDKELETQMNY